MSPKDSLDTQIAQSSATTSILAGGGEMGALMRSLDWETTFLGPPETWPENLRSALSLCLNAQFPIAIYWGKARTLLYNDAWRPIVGDKHPWSMGRPALEVWSEIWDDIDPLFRQVFETGEGIFSKDQLLLMHRHGYTEECYFDFTFSPIKNPDGSVGGILNVVQETTFRVISERRSRLLREMAALTATGTNTEEVCQLAITAIETDLQDIPFALFYLVDSNGKQARFAGSTRGPDSQAIPVTVDLTDGLAGWSLAEVIQSGQATRISDLSRRLSAEFKGIWPEVVQEALALPVTGQGGVTGVLIAGISPRRALDDAYQDFYEMVAGHIATALANAKAYEAERKRAEELEALDKAKTAFFSNVSHEFRTPLTLMLGPIEDALQDAETIPRNRERMDVAHRNALRLQKLVNTLLDFSRIEAGRVQASYRPTDLATFTEELASMFQSAVDKANLKLIVLCSKLSEPIYVDRDMWEKIVLNLLSNAFKHTFEGEIEVGLSCGDGRVKLTVRDTGIGIPADELPHLFERFHRVPNARSRTHEGSGIGLALVNELAKLHGGTVQVESKVGKGTTFTVSIPTGKAHLPPDRIEAEPTLASTAIATQSFVEEALRWIPGEEIKMTLLSSETDEPKGTWLSTKPGSTHKARIILADDNADMRDYVRALLAPHCEVEAVPDGAKALESSHREPPDLILSDVMMPEMDGFELLKALRQDPVLRTVPVILLSAKAGDEAKIEGLEAGADDYLIKPFSAKELLARVKSNLDLHRTREEAQEALRASENRFRIMASNAPVMIWMSDESGQVIFRNQAFANFHGLPETSEETFNWEPLVHPDDIGWVKEAFFTAMKDEKAFNMPEHRLKRHDGQYRWLIANGVPRKSATGKFQGFIGTVVDITERKRIESILAGQKKALEQAVHGDPLSSILETICKTVQEQSDSQTLASVLLMDPDGMHLNHGAAPNLPSDYNKAIDGVEIGPTVGSCGTAAFNRCEVMVRDIENDPLWVNFKDLALSHGLRACWSTPIFSSKNKLLGTFALYYPTVHEPSASDRQVVELLARTAGLIIEWQQDLSERERYQHALKESQARYNLIVQGANDGIWDWDMTTGKSYWNDRFYDILGLSREDIPEPTAEFGFTLIHPDDSAKVEEGIKAHLERQEPYNLELRMLHSSGEYRYLRATAQAAWDEQGKPFRMAGAVTDVTKQKLAEQDLRESEERFRTMAEDTDVLIAVANDRFQSTYFNKAWTKLTGRPEEELLDLGWADLLHPDDREGFLDTYRKALEKKESFEGHFRIMNANGEYRWLWARVPARYRPDGSFAGYISSCIDITEQKQAVLLAKESEERFRNLADAAPVLIGMGDEHGKALYLNKQFLEFLGSSFEEVAEYGYVDIFHPEDTVRVMNEYQKALDKKVSFEVEARFRRYDGEYRWMWVNSAPRFSADGQFLGFVGTHLDVTDRKNAERALQVQSDLTRTVTENATAALMIMDREGRCIYANQTAANITGYSVEEFMGQNIHDLLHYKHLDGTLFPVSECPLAIAYRIQKKPLSGYEDYFIRKDGSFFPVVCANSPLIEDGESAGYVLEFRDITVEKEAKEALVESEERFRAMAENIPNLAWMANADGWIFWYNKRWYEYTGTTPKQMEGWGWQSVHDPEVLPAVMERWKGSIATGEPFEMVFPLKGSDGIFRPFLTRVMPIRDDDDKIVRWFGTNTDVTEAVQSKQALEEHNKMMQMISDAQTLFFSNEDIYDLFEDPLQKVLDYTGSEYGFIGEILNDENGPYLKCCFITNIAWNEETRKLWEENRKTGFEFHKLDNLFGHVITSGEVVISNDTANDPRRSPTGRPEGHPPLNAFLGVPFFKNGKLAGMLGIANRPNGYDMELVEKLRPFTDACANIVTAFQNQREKERLTQILSDSEARYQLLYEWEKKSREALEQVRQARDIGDIFKTIVQVVSKTLNLDRCFIIEFSDGKVRPVQYEYRSSDSVKSFTGIIPPWDFCPYLAMTARNEMSWSADTFIDEVFAGNEQWHQFSREYSVRAIVAAPILYEGELINVLVMHNVVPRQWSDQELFFIRVVTDQISTLLYQARAKKAAEETSKRKSEFLSMMSHELRTPLNSIIGYSQMLDMVGSVNDKQAQYVKNIGTSGQHLLTLINDLLDVSKIEAGRMEIAIEPIELSPLMNEIKSMMQEQAAKKPVSLNIETQVDRMYGERSRVKQILINLISNAIKFNRPDGRVDIKLFKSHDQKWTVMEISDTGIGIPKTKLPELFQKFYQVDNTAARKHEGTGLGLALSKELVELHKGTIEVQSEEGVGTTFTIRMPAKLSTTGKTNNGK